MLKINGIKPLFNKIITTCDVYEEDKIEGGLIVSTKGTIKEYQKVEAIGSTVRDIQVGDLVLINPKRYIVPKHKDKRDNSVKGVIKDELLFDVEFPMVEYGDKKHLLIYDQDVDYIIDGEEIKEPRSNLILPEKKILV